MGRGCHGVQAAVGEDDGRLEWVRVWCVAAVDVRHHAWEFAKGTVTRGLDKDDVGVDVGSAVLETRGTHERTHHPTRSPHRSRCGARSVR
jgi:hypothetical protein